MFAIRVDAVSKKFFVGKQRKSYGSLRDTLVDLARAPFRRARSVLRGQSAGVSERREFWALSDVSFEIQPGEAIGLIGRNGAGKSTLLKVLSRITPPTKGKIQLRGRLGSLLEVGTGFHPELTGRDNIFLSAAILGMRRSEILRQFDAIVAFAEVENFIDTSVKHYSTGMYLRLAFAVAAHLTPEILLIDEVLAVGDVEFQKKCLGKMEDVARQGRTVIFVSHNIQAIQRLCSRAIHLREGRVEQFGAVQDVVNNYLNSKTGQPGERVWDQQTAPGDHVARLRAVRALKVDNSVANSLLVTDSFTLDVEFDVLKSGYKLDVAICLYDTSGNTIFYGGDWSETDWRGKARPVGRHRSRCHIPGDLLNEGQISLMVGIVEYPHGNHAIERNAIVLQVLDILDGTGARGHYPREWPGGAVRPRLKWTFEHSGSL